MDLSVGLGLPQQWEHPTLRAAVAKVVNACEKSGKAAGTIVSDEVQLQRALNDGFSMVAFSSDGAAVVNGMRTIANAFRKFAVAAR
jgi:2-keto-3-deoxy-L-rhamnonate aldolase RhmA